MRLDEWQKYIDSEFLIDGKLKRAKEQENVVEPEQEPLSPDDNSDQSAGIPASAVHGGDGSTVEEIAHTPQMQSAAVSNERNATANLTFDSVIPSFDRYLPSGHPAHTGAMDADVLVERENSGASSNTSEEDGSPPLRQFSNDVPSRNEREAVDVLQISGSAPQQAVNRVDAPTDRRTTLLYSLAVLERLYARVSDSPPSGSDSAQISKRELLERLMDPVLTMDQAAVLLAVSPATIRRYTNRGLLPCFRQGSEMNTVTARESRHRRFRLSDILMFLETRNETLQADLAKEHDQNEQIVAGSSRKNAYLQGRIDG